jgi:pimeloyl-ACP methyl ester carboxylesterase
MLFHYFVNCLGPDIDALVFSYPNDRHLSYPELAERVAEAAPRDRPFVVIAESYSGPVAALLAAQPPGNLRAVVLAASFVSFALGAAGPWLKPLARPILFARAPGFLIRLVLGTFRMPQDIVDRVKASASRVRPEVLALRARAAIRADYRSSLRDARVRVVWLQPTADRLLGRAPLRQARAVRPDLEVVELDGPHLLLQTAPEACLLAMQKLGVFQ